MINRALHFALHYIRNQYRATICIALCLIRTKAMINMALYRPLPPAVATHSMQRRIYIYMMVNQHLTLR